MSNKKNHPHQPRYFDEHGIERFKSNPIIQYLLDYGGIDMNALAIFAHQNSDISKRDQAQFAQLIGYSVSGWGDLNYMTDDIYNEALSDY